MSLESIVTSLELSQKLDEIGVKQESLFYWYDAGCHASDSADIIYTVSNDYISDTKQDRICAAFTAQELWDMIDDKYLLDIRLSIDGDIVAESGSFCGYEQSCNLANCLAQLIIAQKENKNA